MKGEARLIMGATLVMAVSLVLVLGLVIVLLAELYCSLLHRHRHRHRHLTTTSNTCAASGEVTTTTTTTTIAAASPLQSQSQPQSPTAPSLTSFYSQGVLRAPRNILFPSISDKTETFDLEKQHSTPLQFESQSQSRRHGLFTSFPSPMFTPLGSPKNVDTSHFQEFGADFGAHLVYISNPMYDNEGARPSREDNTPFETPDSSPSRLGTGYSSDESTGEVDKEKLSLTSSPSSVPVTPPLTPMEKLPAEACSISLRDARSLGTSDSDSNKNHNDASSSTSGTPCTSPSW